MIPNLTILFFNKDLFHFIEFGQYKIQRQTKYIIDIGITTKPIHGLYLIGLGMVPSENFFHITSTRRMEQLKAIS